MILQEELRTVLEECSGPVAEHAAVLVGRPEPPDPKQNQTVHDRQKKKKEQKRIKSNEPGQNQFKPVKKETLALLLLW